MSERDQIAQNIINGLCIDERLSVCKQNFMALENDFDNAKNTVYHDEEPMELPIRKLKSLEEDISILTGDLEILARIMNKGNWVLAFNQIEREILLHLNVVCLDVNCFNCLNYLNNNCFNAFSDRMALNEDCLKNIEHFLTNTLFAITHNMRNY